MAQYTITLSTTATQTVTVDADSLDEALDKAHNREEFYAVMGQKFEFPDEVEAITAYLPDGREIDLD